MVRPVIKIGDIMMCKGPEDGYSDNDDQKSYWLVIDVIMEDSVLYQKLLFIISDNIESDIGCFFHEYNFNYSDEFISYPENTWIVQ